MKFFLLFAQGGICIIKKRNSNDIFVKFKDKPFTNKELYSFYLESEPMLKYSTFRWRVHNLKEKKYIYNISRGLYKLGTKSNFSPVLSNKIILLYKTLNQEFPYTKYCIWETAWLHNFMVHQPTVNNIIIETEKDAASAVFNCLKEYYDNVFINPSKDLIENYIDSQTENIIVKNLITTSPVITKDQIKIPKAEKIMIDIFIEYLYKAYQANELINIYNAFIETYEINISTLCWYAAKRNYESKICDFVTLNNIIDTERLGK